MHLTNNIAFHIAPRILQDNLSSEYRNFVNSKLIVSTILQLDLIIERRIYSELRTEFNHASITSIKSNKNKSSHQLK